MSLKMHVEKQLEGFYLKIDLETEEGVLGLLGYSGSGKTMTLKMIAGIVTPDVGTIILNDRILFDSERHINLKPQERHVGLMFQSYALFNHMSVYDNIAIGMRGLKKEKEEIIAYYLKLLELDHLKDKKPKALSGGQKQRVALARILAQEPELLMLDEPFSALDSHLRFTIEGAFKRALKAFKGNVLYISHNRQEIYKYCDEVAIVAEGCIAEKLPTEALFNKCQTLNGAKLTGCRNITSVVWENNQRAYVPEWQLYLDKREEEPLYHYVGIREGDLIILAASSQEEGILVQRGQLFKMPDKVKVELGLESGEKIIYTCSNREYEKQRELLQEKQVKLIIQKDKLLLLKK